MVERLRPRRRGSRLRAVLIFAVAAALFSISAVVAFYTDFLWFKEVGFSGVFWKIFSTKMILGAAFGVVFFLFALVNLLLVVRLMPSGRLGGPKEDPMQRYRLALAPYLKWIAAASSAFLALLFGLGVAPEWQKVLLYLNSVSFKRVDPVFKRDISFFVFKLPMYQVLYQWLFSTLIVVTIAVAAAHYLAGGIRPQAAFDRVSPQVKAHLSVLIGLIALVRAWGYRLDQFRLVYSTRGNVTGASYTDINAQLPALKLMVVISILGAILFLVNIRFKGWALPLAALGLWVLVSVLAGAAFPFIVQRFRVEPAQIEKERAFIGRNISATRAAYRLDAMKVQEYPAKLEISKQTLDSNPQTIDNIRLFDPDILKTAYKSLAEFKTYYEFKDVDVDRYTINGAQRQVMLSARELTLANFLDAKDKSWVTSHLFYTHGFGVVASPTNEVSSEGNPNFFVQGIPPKATSPELKIDKGGIYYGERISDYSVVKTKQRELDYDEQDRRLTTIYGGKGGIPLSGLVRRAALAWRFKDVNLLISGSLKSDSRIMYLQRVRDRLTTAAPFLSFDGDPYPVIAGGRIVWMADGYTTTDMYPYSERLDFGSRTPAKDLDGAPSVEGRQNYIRNSVKATVDAYDGTIKLYVWDQTDPLIKSWRKAFPALFKDGATMPSELKKHVRYPEDLFRIQTFIYSRYHLTDPVDFFTQNNRWVIPKDPNQGEGAPAGQTEEVQPYYVLMKLPGAASENYFQILPMNPKDKPNMVAYIAANSDPERYGELNDFRFPKTTTVFGVGQIHARINSDPNFSREKTLLGQAGSKLLFGDLLVIPVQESILYVQPVFLQADVNAIPELKFVALATGDRVVLGKTLSEALNLLVQKLGEPSLAPVPGTPPAAGTPQPAGVKSLEQVLKEALDHEAKAEEAARTGDWATYGAEQQALKQVLQSASGGQPTSTATAVPGGAAPSPAGSPSPLRKAS